MVIFKTGSHMGLLPSLPQPLNTDHSVVANRQQDGVTNAKGSK